jgi:hypothetical protein
MNQDPFTGNAPTVASYNENLTVPVLSKCSDYYCSIIRFAIPLNYIPIFVMPIIATQANPDLSSLIFGIRLGGVNFPVNVVYIRVDHTHAAPTPSGGPIFFTQEQLISPYYWVFSFDHMINLMNTAIAQAVTNAGIVAAAPFLSYNAVTQLISLNVTNAFLITGAELYLNTEASEFLASFNYDYYGPNQPQGRDLSFILNPVPPGSAAGGPFVFVESFNTIDLWFSLRKILIK